MRLFYASNRIGELVTKWTKQSREHRSSAPASNSKRRWRYKSENHKPLLLGLRGVDYDAHSGKKFMHRTGARPPGLLVSRCSPSGNDVHSAVPHPEDFPAPVRPLLREPYVSTVQLVVPAHALALGALKLRSSILRVKRRNQY